MVELLIVVASLAVIGALAVLTIGGAHSDLRESKLKGDVAQINTAIDVFLSNGGSLDEISTAQDVLTELKKESSSGKTVVGLRGRSVDNRLQAVEETDGELRKRAVWQEALGKFVVKESRSGVREFIHNEELAGDDFGTTDRKTRMSYNGADGWVWKSVDHGSYAVGGPTSLPTLNAETLDAAEGGSSAANSRLRAPTISPDSRERALASFPLQVSIAKHPNDPQDAKIFYSTTSGAWLEYSVPFSVDPGTHVSAYVSYEDSAWMDSTLSEETYTNYPAGLEISLDVPKNPITYAEAGGALEEGNYTAEPALEPIRVTLTSAHAIPSAYENSDYFEIHWTYNGSDPRTSDERHTGGYFRGNYPGDDIDYTIPHWDGASLLPVQVVAQSKNVAFMEDSRVLDANINIAKMQLPRPVIRYNDSDTSRGDTVEIDKVVDGGDMPVGARIYYTTDGTDPGDDGHGNPESGTLYTGPFDPLLDQGLETEAQIVARVYPPEEYRAWFDISELGDAVYTVPLWEISGDASGWFTDAEGGEGLVASFGGDNLFTEEYSYSTESGWKTVTEVVGGSIFDWGDPGNWGTGSNVLSFRGAEFEDVSADEKFFIGNLDYYNGTIALSSAATAIDFTVELDFGGTPALFDYQFDLLSTPNTGDAWENADFVWFNDTQSSQTLNLYGVDYSLNLEFGQTTQYGYSNIDQFHVQEDRSASASIYATLVELGSWW